METINANELQLADTIDMNPGMNSAYMTATVKQVTTHEVHLIRPYMMTQNFSYTGGVICSIGWEDITILVDSCRKFSLLERKTLK